MRQATRWFIALFLYSFALLPVASSAQSEPGDQNPFPLLPGLEKPVEFWRKIFTEYSTSQLVFFDELDMSKVYEVLDVGDQISQKNYIGRQKERIAAAHGVEPERIRAQRGIKERTADGLKRSGRYMGQMRQIFRERGLPAELAYLPMVESSFNLNARSSAGALGMWQFMRRTGREYLRVNRHVDERKDPFESTRAAASFLGESYERLGKWPLAITSYNYGPAGIARAVAQIESDNLVDLINNYQHRNWGFAPKNFYAEFLAAVEIGKNIQQYFPGLELDPPLEFQEVEVKKAISVAALARSHGLTSGQFLEWNPAFSRTSAHVHAGYRVKLPANGKTEPVVEVAKNRPQEKPQVVRHRVRRGESLWTIARRYGASVEEILEFNDIRRAHRIQIGATLLIPKL